MSVTWNVTVSVPAAVDDSGADERPQPDNNAATNMAKPISRVVTRFTLFAPEVRLVYLACFASTSHATRKPIHG